MIRGIGGYFWAILSGVLYGVAPIMILDIVGSGISTNAGCLMIRYAVTSVILLPFALYYRKESGLTKKRGLEIVAASVLMALTAISLYTSYYWLPAGIGMAISYLYPLVVLQVGIWVCHKKPSKRIIVSEIFFLAGMVLLCDVSILPEGGWTGVLFALLSALAYAAFLLWEERRNLGVVHPIVFTEILSVTCACCLACFNLVTNQFYAKLTAAAMLHFVVVGLVGALAVVTQLMAVKQIGAMYTSVLGTLELVVCCLGSAIVLKEKFSVESIVGTGLILIAVILVTTYSETSADRIRFPN